MGGKWFGSLWLQEKEKTLFEGASPLCCLWWCLCGGNSSVAVSPCVEKRTDIADVRLFVIVI